MFHFTHAFVSPKADGTDPTLVRPSSWNADHQATADGPGVVGRTAGGSGPLSLLDITATFLPSGIALPFFGNPNAVPAGWLICHGQAVSRTQYPNLFAAIGVTYGPGDGSTTFNLPDTSGRVIAGMDPTGTRLTNATMSPDGNTLGAAGGVQTEQVRIYGNVDVNSNVGVTVSGSLSGNVTGESGSGLQFGGSGVFVQAGDGVQVSGAMTGSGGGAGSGTIRNDGNNLTGAADNVQPTILANFIIKT